MPSSSRRQSQPMRCIMNYIFKNCVVCSDYVSDDLMTNKSRPKGSRRKILSTSKKFIKIVHNEIEFGWGKGLL